MSIGERIDFVREAWKFYKAVKEEGGSSGGGGFGLLSGINRRGEAPRRGTAELMAAYRTMPWLRAVGDRISSSVASTQWRLYAGKGPNGKAIRHRSLQSSDRAARQKGLKRLKAAGSLIEIEAHPFLDMIDSANPGMTGLAARKITQIYLDLKGECFWIIEKNPLGMPIEFYPIPPHWVKDTPSTGKPFFKVEFRDWKGEIPETEIVWMRELDPLNPYGRGIGIAESLGDELDTDEYASKHVKSWFYNRAVPELLIGVEGASEPSLTAAKTKWENEHRGFWKSFKTHWHSGKMNVTQLTHTFADQQLIQLREWQRNMIQQVYGLPPEIMGIIENSNRATIDGADYIFARWVTLPRLEFLRSELQEKIIPLFDERIILEYESPVPEDREFFLKVAQAAPWSRTKNEWRDLQGLEPDEKAGDVYLTPAGLMPEKFGEDQTLDPDPMPPPIAPPPIPPQEPEEPEEEPEDDDGDIEPPGGQKSASGRNKAISEGDLDNIIAALAPIYLNNELDPVFHAMIEGWGSRVLEELGVDVNFSMINPLVVEHLQEKSGTKISGINDFTREKLRNSLVEGVRAGEGIPDLAKRVSATFADAKGRRAEVIARTEAVGSGNFANYSAFKQSGIVDVHEWLSTMDGRARDSHEALNGKQAVLGKPFTITEGANYGATALHPGSFGIAGEDIQCRCTTIAIIADPESDDSSRSYTAEQKEAIWKKFDTDLIPWERRLKFALKRAFQKQQNAAMEELNKLRRNEDA